MGSSERMFLTKDQVELLLPEGDRVHTYRNPRPNVLLGSDWDRGSVLALADRHRFELSGESATRMGHGICVYDGVGNRPLFVETRSNAGEILSQFHQPMQTNDGLAGKSDNTGVEG